MSVHNCQRSLFVCEIKGKTFCDQLLHMSLVKKNQFKMDICALTTILINHYQHDSSVCLSLTPIPLVLLQK